MRGATLIVALLIGGALALDGPATAQKTKKPLRYSHSLHTKNGVDQKDCSTCHELDSKFKVKPPTSANPHKPCATSGCHGEEFFSTKPTICVVCHADSRPWVKQTAEIKDHPDSEFGSDLSHKTHATGRVGGKGNGACKTCHGDKFRDQPSTGGHGDCAPCHARQEKPSMTNCGGCHRLGAKRARAEAMGGPWSVAKLFAHNTHGRDPRTPQTETECLTCHQGITKATKLAEVKNPTMKSCDTCHDGKAAFKTTGFQCYRCHSEEAGRLARRPGAASARAAMR